MREQLIKIIVDEYDALEHDLDAVIKLEADTESVLRCMEKALLIQRVSQQREPLLAYHKHLDSFNDPTIYNATKSMIDDYFADNCG